jgi:hypothetical protein
LSDPIEVQANRLRTAEATVRLYEKRHGNIGEYAAAGENLNTRNNELERECDDLMRKYNWVANTNLDLHPLRMDQPGNLAEINEDRRREIEALKADLDIARRTLPAPDLHTASRETNKLRTQEARCQLQKDGLQKQIADLRNLAAMTVDDEKIALRPQADELQDRPDAARSDVV